MRFALLLAFVGCTTLSSQPLFPEAPIPDAGPDVLPLAPTFDSLEQNIFRPRCGLVCHGTKEPAGNMDLLDDPYGALVGVEAMGSQCEGTGWVRLVPGDPTASLVYQKVLAKSRGGAAPCGDPMPQGDPRLQHALTDAQVAAIRDWISSGAAK